ncbi:MAG: insulinase family protein [Chromatiaceae bacterium]|jgi:zinc protease|nr:insulinase family protein [Chromatiaceae bacterium]
MTARYWAPLLLALLVGVAQAGPRVESWQTSRGAKVMYVQAPDLPMVDVRVVFDAGSARDGGLAGLARFVNNTLNEGAGDWDADNLALRFEDHGIEFGHGSLRDMAWVSLRSLTDPAVLEVALDTTAAVLAAPRFDKEAVERVRQQMQIGLRSSLQSPGRIAERRFYRALYGDHPYAHAPDGDDTSLAGISRDDLVGFHQRYYVAANAVVAIVGAVDRALAEQIAERITGGLPIGQHAGPLPPPPVVSGGELREDFPSSQTHIYLGQAGMARHDPDYYALYVGNHVLGGGSLVSTLGEEVRNKRGLSYSVSSFFSPMQVEGPFLIVAQTKNAKADETLRVMRETLARFVSDGPSEQDLEAAKSNLIGGFPLRISSNGKIIEYLAMMGFYDYPLDYLETLTGKLAAVSVAQVRDAFSRRIGGPAGIAVVVGGNG